MLISANKTVHNEINVRTVCPWNIKINGSQSFYNSYSVFTIGRTRYEIHNKMSTHKKCCSYTDTKWEENRFCADL
jgi:hypothetical protein